MIQRSQWSVGLVVSPAFGERGSFTPLGLAYLNGTLRKAGVTPSYFDVNDMVRGDEKRLHSELVSLGFSPDKGGFFGPDLPLLCHVAGKAVQEEAPPIALRIKEDVERRVSAMEHLDVALLTLWDSNVAYVMALGCALRRQGVRVVVGGPGVTLEGLRRLLVALGAADAVVAGEGEGAVVPVLDALMGHGMLERIGGVTCLSDAGITSSPSPAPLRIHDIPEPSFEGFPMPEWIPILTSRGCIRDCSFCTEKFFWKRYRQRKVECVLAELERRIEDTGIRRFEFNDDLLNGHVRWLDRFCDELLIRKLDIRWTCFMEPYRLTPELIRKVADSGCTLIKFGVQHFDREMLNIIGRGTEVEDVVETLGYAAECGIRVSFDLIPGHPGELARHHETNMRVLYPLLKRSPLLEVNVNPFLLLHGSPVETHPERFGVKVERWETSHFPEGMRASLEEVDGVFVRGYTQEPSLDIVEERTEALEALASRAQSSHGFSGYRVGDTVLEGEESVCVLPEGHNSPRDLLDTISVLRKGGVRRIAIQAPPSILNQPAFLSRAKREGLTHWIMFSEGKESPESLKECAELLERAGLLWWLRMPLSAASNTHAETVRAVVNIGGYGAVLDGSQENDHWGERDVAIVLDWFHEGAVPQRRLALAGVPACFLRGEVENLLPSPIVADPDPHKRWVQQPVCRTCKLSPHCPGATRADWNRGEVHPIPFEGRPVQDLSFKQIHEAWR